MQVGVNFVQSFLHGGKGGGRVDAELEVADETEEVVEERS